MRKKVMFGGAVLTAVIASAAVAETYQSAKLAEDGIHDPTNESVQNIMQEPGEAMVDFPMDRLGMINWVKAMDEGFINPRKSLSGDEFDGEMMLEMDLDIIMKQTSFMPYVRFPHLPHTKWLNCSNCHPKIFVPQLEGNPVTMEKVLRGEYCGVCHDKVAFSLMTCERCHSVPHEQSAPAFVGK